MREIHAYKVLAETDEGKRSLGRFRRRQEGEIKINLEKCGVKVWTTFILLRIGTGGWGQNCEQGNEF